MTHARTRQCPRQTVIRRARTKQGKLETRAYVVNVVFLNGQTYYQHPLKDKTWRAQKGMTFKDGIASFRRGRTTVNFNGVNFTTAGPASNGDAHFHAHVAKNGLSGTVDVLVSRGEDAVRGIRDRTPDAASEREDREDPGPHDVRTVQSAAEHHGAASPHAVRRDPGRHAGRHGVPIPYQIYPNKGFLFLCHICHITPRPVVA